MIYMHYCPKCEFIHMLSGHRMECPGCNEKLTELKLDYMEYYQMNLQERSALQEKCKDPKQLQELQYVYKKHKFSKWYKEGKKRG